jgi:hypothetical protein
MMATLAFQSIAPFARLLSDGLLMGLAMFWGWHLARHSRVSPMAGRVTGFLCVAALTVACTGAKGPLPISSDVVWCALAIALGSSAAIIFAPPLSRADGIRRFTGSVLLSILLTVGVVQWRKMPVEQWWAVAGASSFGGWWIGQFSIGRFKAASKEKSLKSAIDALKGEGN